METVVLSPLLKVKIEKAEKQIKLFFVGEIDENAEFTEIPSMVNESLVLDMEGVSLLNSSGLRSWVRWTQPLKSRAVYFQNCPKLVVHQMNILDGFFPHGSIISSFYVPYFCESCDREELYLAVRGKDYFEGTVDTKEGIALSETIPCPQCHKEIEMDVIKDKYFRFLKYRR